MTDTTDMGDAVAVAPTRAGERVVELDVIRGFALFGILIANLTMAAVDHLMATSDQLRAVPLAYPQALAGILVSTFVENKANTLFTVLFGIGFTIQIERLASRGATAIYARRLLVLFVFGLVHMVFVFVWDVLTSYALLGFALLAMRRVNDRVMVWGGLALMLAAPFVARLVPMLIGAPPAELADAIFSEAGVRARQAISEAGDYPGLVAHFLKYTWVELLTGAELVWMVHALGRFMVGAWIGRQGWLRNAGAHLPGFRRVFWWTFPAGLAVELVRQTINTLERLDLVTAGPALNLLRTLSHTVAAPLMAAGYFCAIVLLLHTDLGRRLLAPLAYAGRMALTNYVMQSFIIGFVLFGVGPGLARAAHAGPGELALWSIAGFAGQVAFSRWWLKRFAYGPLEWLWRALTYGHAPRWRAGAT